jgi:hypothetical protein
MAETYTKASLTLATTAITATGCLVYTATGPTIIIGAQAANIDGSNSEQVDFALDVGGAGTTIRYYAKGTTVATGAALNLIADRQVLETGDKLRARAGSASGVDLIVSLVEIS